MRVLYLSYDGLTDPLGRSQVLPYLTSLSEKDFQFTIISFEKPNRINTGRATVEEICQKFNIEWCPLLYTKNPPVISTMIDIKRMRRLAAQLHQKQPFDIMHCRSYIAALVGLRMKRKFRTKFLFDMRGFWADERVEGGLWNLKNPLYRLIYTYFKKKERQFLAEADGIVSLTHNAKEELAANQEFNQPLPITVIPCCADTDHFDTDKLSPQHQKELRISLGISESDFVITYLGSFGTWYLVDEMLQFFHKLIKTKPSAKFLFITPESPENIYRAVDRIGVPKEKIIVTSSQREEVPLHVSLGQLSLFFIKPVYSKKASSPVKQGEIMSMGIPIICNSKVGDTDFIINNSKAGILINEFTKHDYEQAIAKLDQVLSLNPKNIRSAAEKYYSLKKGVEDYARIYETL